MTATPRKSLYIGEGFEGPGVNLAHVNVLVGPREGPAGQAFSTALATPSAGHAPFVVIAQPGVPTKPLTLYVNKAQIANDFHGNATWGASQAGIAKAVAEAPESGTLPPEAENDWVVVTANWGTREPTTSTPCSRTTNAPAATRSSRRWRACRCARRCSRPRAKSRTRSTRQRSADPARRAGIDTNMPRPREPRLEETWNTSASANPA